MEDVITTEQCCQKTQRQESQKEIVADVGVMSLFSSLGTAASISYWSLTFHNVREDQGPKHKAGKQDSPMKGQANVTPDQEPMVVPALEP